MSNDKYGDSDLVYWLGHSINAMTREELQIALGEAMMQIENLKNKNYYWMMAFAKERTNNEKHNSRVASIELRTSCC